METIDIKCPQCGKILRLQSQPGIERMFVPCPACGTRSQFAACERVVRKTACRATELPSYMKADKAFLVDKTTGCSYELLLGHNSVGRAHVTSSAQVHQNADTILVIKDGAIIEQGNHEQLLEQKGFYHSLYNSQFS